MSTTNFMKNVIGDDLKELAENDARRLDEAAYWIALTLSFFTETGEEKQAYVDDAVEGFFKSLNKYCGMSKRSLVKEFIEVSR